MLFRSGRRQGGDDELRAVERVAKVRGHSVQTGRAVTTFRHERDAVANSRDIRFRAPPEAHALSRECQISRRRERAVAASEHRDVHFTTPAFRSAATRSAEYCNSSPRTLSVCWPNIAGGAGVNASGGSNLIGVPSVGTIPCFG